jgi:hypothetical protein
MTTRLLLGDDISAESHEVSLIGADGQVLVRHRPFANTVSGYRELRQFIHEALAAYDTHALDVAGEATGLFWWHAFYNLAHDPELDDVDLHLSLFNPRWTHAFKLALGQREHTDFDDAYAIAERLRFSRARHPLRFDERYLGLQRLTRLYYHISHTLAQEKTYFSTFLFLKASAYRQFKPFSDVFGQTSQAILTEYATLDELADLPTVELAELLQRLAQGHLPDPPDNARKLQDAARQSFRLPDGLVGPVNLTLELALEHIRLLERHARRVEHAIENELDCQPVPARQVAVIDSIGGLGLITSAGQVAEIQDPRRFLQGQVYDKHLKRYRPKNLRDGEAGLAKWGGLWWPKHRSGRFTAEDVRLARDGNRYFRYYVVQGANSARGHCAEYAAYYPRKKAESATHAHKRALTLTARKPVGLVFGLLLRDEFYRPPQEVAHTETPMQAAHRRAREARAARRPPAL